jgi:RNA polymerase sigma factor (TIGR02999 family)
MSPESPITQWLVASCKGDKSALDQLMASVYGELRRLAESYLQSERADHTLQATALVHEAYIRLIDQRYVDWKNRAQFFALAAKMMRRILVNHAEAHNAAKRGGGAQKLSLDDAISFFAEQHVDLLALHESLDRLALLDERQTQIIELRFFGGLTIEEIADVLKISPATVKREWGMAKTWLFRELNERRTPT